MNARAIRARVWSSAIAAGALVAAGGAWVGGTDLATTRRGPSTNDPAGAGPGDAVRATGASPRTADSRPRLGASDGSTTDLRPRLGKSERAARGIALARLSVAGVTPDGVITFDARDSDRVRSGDTVVIVARAAPIAVGTLRAEPGGRPTATPDWTAVAPAAGLEAVVVPSDASAGLRERLSADGSLWSVVSEVAPDGATCRLDARPDDGFLPGDRLWALRGRLPIAQVEIERIDPRGGAAARVTRLVANATIAVGDPVRLAHGPAAVRTGRLRSHVLRAEAAAATEDLEVWFPLDPRDGAAAGDRFVVEDEEGSYVGLVELREYRGPFAVGPAAAAMRRRLVRVGDGLRRRVPRDVARGIAALRVFRTEGDYCLVNGGEIDGLAVGRRLLAYDGDRLSAVLRISTVKVDFCGATVETAAPGDPPRSAAEPAGAADGAPPAVAPSPPGPFCEVRVRPPPLPRRAAGRLTFVTAGGRLAVLEREEGGVVAAGEVVEVEGRVGPSCGIVLDTAPRRVLVYFAASWVYPGGIEPGTPGWASDDDDEE